MKFLKFYSRDGRCFRVFYKKCRKNNDGSVTCAKRTKVLRWETEIPCSACEECEQS